MDVGLSRKGPLRRHDGLPPQGRRRCARQRPCREQGRAWQPVWRQARFV